MPGNIAKSIQHKLSTVFDKNLGLKILNTISKIKEGENHTIQDF